MDAPQSQDRDLADGPEAQLSPEIIPSLSKFGLEAIRVQEAAEGDFPEGFLGCGAQEVEVRLSAWTRVDNGGKVAREVLSIASLVHQAECKGKLESDLGLAEEFAARPGLTIESHLAAREGQ